MKLRKETERLTFQGTGSLAQVTFYDTRSFDILSLAVRNLGSGSVSAFELRVKPSSSYTASPILVKNSNFLTPDENVISCNIDPTTLGSGSTALVDIDCSYRAYVHIFANVPIGTTLELMGGLYVYDGK